MLQYQVVAYRELSESRLSSYLASLPEIAARLGPRPALWQISEVAIGAFSRVFIVTGSAGEIAVKQALPAAVDLAEGRCNVPLDRMTIEEAALALQSRFTPGLVPRVTHYDSDLSLLVMDRLQPHVTLRQGALKGRVFPLLAEQLSVFLARTAFFTSDLAMPSEEKRERLAFFAGNVESCKVTEYLLLTEPYTHAERNHWTAPALDDLAREVRTDDALKRAIATLQLKFMTDTQALMHGALDGASIMLTETDTRVIGPGSAAFGPIGFDLGTMVGHLLLIYFSQAGHAPEDAPRTTYERWLLEVLVKLWRGFSAEFLRLWRDSPTGDAFPKAFFEGPGGVESLRTAQTDFLKTILEDTLRFAGATMIRHTLGRDHIDEFEQIGDPARRAACERRAVIFARELVKDAHFIGDMGELVEVARQLREDSL